MGNNMQALESGGEAEDETVMQAPWRADEPSAVIRPRGVLHTSKASYIFNSLIGLLNVGTQQTKHPGRG